MRAIFMKSSVALVVLWLLFVPACKRTPSPSAVIVCSDQTPLMILVGREVHRYVYLRTGELLPILPELPPDGDAVLISTDQALGEQSYRLETAREDGRSILRITGGSGTATLYGVYRYAGPWA